MGAAAIQMALVVCLLALYLLAMFFLRRRNLADGEYLLWGLFALLVPALGPFLVILLRPGKTGRSADKADAENRAGSHPSGHGSGGSARAAAALVERLRGPQDPGE